MADEYTPTMSDFREAWVDMRANSIQEVPLAQAEYDRALAAYEKALRERIAQDIEAVPHGHRALYPASYFASIARGATR